LCMQNYNICMILGMVDRLAEKRTSF
jgi:hypothetical protein